MASFAYDVFISFRGEDTRYKFIGHLHKELKRKGINTFIDDDNKKMRIGEDISPALSKAIEESKISIIVLSENYASSTWCLEELVKILACTKRNNKQLVFPVFYHVNPSDVRKQKNSYGNTIAELEDRFRNDYQKVQRWKFALSEIGAKKGFHITPADKEYESNFIERIVQEVYDNINPKPLHVARDCTENVKSLVDMKPNDDKTSDKLYNEVLDTPLPKVKGLKSLKVEFHHATKDEADIHTIILPEHSTTVDVLDDLKTKVELSRTNAELRLLLVQNHKIYQVFSSNERIENRNGQYWTFRAEEIPEEEKNLGPHDRLIQVRHFTKVTAGNVMYFGEPFFLVVHEGETLAKIKVRIQKKLRVPSDEFVKWKFAFLSFCLPEYLTDSDIVSSRFKRRNVFGDWDRYLGLKHTDNGPKR